MPDFPATSVRRPEAKLNWARQILSRLSKHFWLKACGTTLFTWAFFIGYFHVLRNPAFAVTQMPLTELDRLVDFTPPALLAYVSLWLYVSIPPGLLLSVREIVAYGLWIAGLCIAGLVCFYVWPTAVPRVAVGATQFPGFSVLQDVDAPANACPSLHVATAVFSAIWLHRQLGEVCAGTLVRAGNWCWFGLIAYSTLATKQHVAVDVLAGFALGTAFAFPSQRFWPLGAPSREVRR